MSIDPKWVLSHSLYFFIGHSFIYHIYYRITFFLRGKSKATIRAMIPMTAIIINCNVKLDNGWIRIINNGAMAVPKNRIKVLTDKKKPWLRLTTMPTFEIVDGIANAIPPTNITPVSYTHLRAHET